MQNNIVRLSHTITSNIPSYGNRDYVKIEKKSSIMDGDTANTSSWYFSNNHIGTHIDTPYHFDEQGKMSCNFSAGEFYFNSVALVDIPCINGSLIDSQEIIKRKIIFPIDIELLLIRTGYEKFRQSEKYWNDNPGLAPELAGYLRNSYPKLRCVGFDFISLTSWNFRSEGRESHKAFLCPGGGEREILVIEDMALSNIQNSINKVIVAPLFVEDGNGGAVTVFAEINLDN